MADTRRGLASNWWAMPAALATVHAVLAALAFHQAPFTGGDDATYISLARSLIERHDYTDIWDPALPAHTQYPPIFPIIVAGGLLAGLTPPEGLKIMMIVISTLAVFASCTWLQRTTTRGVALCAGFFIAISPEVLRLGQEVLSDPAFWLFSILALIVWARADTATGPAKDAREMPAGWVVAATAATLAAYFTRSAGAPLLLAVLVWLGLRRQIRAIAIVTAMSAPPIFLWWLRGRGQQGGGYLAPFLSVDPYNPSLGNVTLAGLAERVAENSSKYASGHLSRMVFGTPRTGVIFGVAFAAAMIYGWWKRAKKPQLPELWLPIYLALVILWPVAWAGARFLFPVAPLVALYVGETIARLARAASHPRIFAAALLTAGVITIGPALKKDFRIGQICRERYYNGEMFPCTEPAFAAFFTTAERTRGKLPPNSVVLSRKPTVFFVHSGYQSRVYPFFNVPDSLFNFATRSGAKYLVIDVIGDLAPRFLHPILMARRSDFCIIPELSTGEAAFAKIEVGGPPRPPGSEPNSFRACPLDTAATQ